MRLLNINILNMSLFIFDKLIFLYWENIFKLKLYLRILNYFHYVIIKICDYAFIYCYLIILFLHVIEHFTNISITDRITTFINWLATYFVYFSYYGSFAVFIVERMFMTHFGKMLWLKNLLLYIRLIHGI